MKYSPADSPAVDDATAKQQTGRTLAEWFAILDAFGGLEQGRRKCTWHLMEDHGLADAWWQTTIAVEYEIARGAKEKDGRPTGYGICATKTFKAPVEAVFSVWADAAAWPKWFGTNATAEIKVGGKFSSADGESGEFSKVRENKDLKFTWNCDRHTPGSIVEVLFQSKPGDKCVVMVNHNRIQKRKEADELREAWGGALDAMKKLVEK